MISPEPYLIHFSQIGESAIGFISVAEQKNIPFEIRRVYWTYFTPENVTRGRHAHRTTEYSLPYQARLLSLPKTGRTRKKPLH